MGRVALAETTAPDVLLLLDIQSGEVAIETPGLDKLYPIVVDLEQRLKMLLRCSPA